MNALLPEDIAVTGCTDVRADFNPRRDATSRTYRYLIWNRPVRSPFAIERAAHVRVPLDVRAMDEAARVLQGTHDMSAFIPRKTESSRVRTIYSASCRRDGDFVGVELEANGFVRQMVRAIVGTLIRVGTGRLTSAEFDNILLSRDRAQAGDTAPAHGLYLVDVRYPAGTMDVASQPALGHPWLAGIAADHYEEMK
jgi:tRNA pseudouridine38-40 synthase